MRQSLVFYADCEVNRIERIMYMKCFFQECCCRVSEHGDALCITVQRELFELNVQYSYKNINFDIRSCELGKNFSAKPLPIIHPYLSETLS
jgi:hypothetical protein